jgi:hypothetical protein
MQGKKILFVTYHDESIDNVMSYAVDLAKTMNKGIGILMIYKRKVFEKFEDVMTVVAFAEEGDHKTARELIMEDYGGREEVYEKRIALMTEKCKKAGVAVDVSTAATDIVSAIKSILKQDSKIDMVLLSPGITSDGNISAKTLNKLVKTTSRPIVTMAKQVDVA